MRSFRASLATRLASGGLVLFLAVGAACVLALRSILYSQLDGTLLHLAEVEAKAGAATSGPDFQFHEGVLLAARDAPAAELTRYAQLWTRNGLPVVRSRNLPADLTLPPDAFRAAQAGRVGWETHTWRGRSIRSVIYPLRLVGAAHGVHLLQVAAPLEPVEVTLSRFGFLVLLVTLLAATAAYALGWQIAGVALRPTGAITEQAEAIEAGTLSARITAHADVREFRRLVTVLNAMLDRLDQAFEVQRRFTADASHELRGPLNVLRGDIEVTLKRERSAAEYREALERCREEVLQLSRLAADLLVLARSDAGQPLEQRIDVDLLALGQRVGERYAPLARQRQIQLQVLGEGALVAGDASLLERVVGNLVDNAVKYSPRGGAVRVEVGRADGGATMTVADQGPGVPAEELPLLFTRFHRGDPARPRAEGSGLGLAIARAGAEAHGGTLEYVRGESGARFRLTLPLAAPQVTAPRINPA
jgi:two-component system OmpR family sensor kinase